MEYLVSRTNLTTKFLLRCCQYEQYNQQN